MKAIVIEQYGSSEELVEKEVQNPEIKEDQVLVELHATSINPIDWKVRAGYMKEMLKLDFPAILGWDAAGIIKKTGSSVTKFKTGDKVFARPSQANGTYAEYVAIEEDLLAAIPEGVDFNQAAAVPLAGLTAWQCLIDYGHITSGDKVLIHAGAGGVGSLGIQIAKSFGAHVTATASGKNESYLKELGVDQFINYKEEDFTKVSGDFDIVVDTIGGEVLDKSIYTVKKGGVLVSTAGQPDEEKVKEQSITASPMWLEPNGKQLTKMGELMQQGKLKAHIGNTFPLDEKGLREAHQLSETQHTKGKIVIEVK